MAYVGMPPLTVYNIRQDRSCILCWLQRWSRELHIEHMKHTQARSKGLSSDKHEDAQQRHKHFVESKMALFGVVPLVTLRNQNLEGCIDTFLNLSPDFNLAALTGQRGLGMRLGWA